MAHSSSNVFLLLLVQVTEAFIPVSWRQLNSAVSFTLKFLQKKMTCAIPGRAVFDEVLVFVVVPVTHDIKNWIPEICRICSSYKYIVLQTNRASLWSSFNHTSLQDIAEDFSLTYKQKLNIAVSINLNQYIRQRTRIFTKTVLKLH